jgi:hypothetical protein
VPTGEGRGKGRGRGTGGGGGGGGRADLTRPAPSEDAAPPTAAVLAAARLVAAAATGDKSDEAKVMLIEASGTAVDGGGGCVASVEVSWKAEEWHPADIAAVGPAVAWSLRWGLPWQRLHGAAPGPGDAISLRASDDSGNAALFADVGVVV